MTYASARVWRDEPRRRLQRFFDEYFEDGSLHNVLDAGAGYELSIDIPLHVHLTALDISKPALAKNENADEKIVGDLQTYRFPADHFDAIICWWVLEHLPRPRDAMANMTGALRHGGLLIVAVPYLLGFEGVGHQVNALRIPHLACT
jgi:SAM-dependent methyltransferase